MGRKARKKERQRALEASANPSMETASYIDDVLALVGRGVASKSGAHVDTQTALNTATVLACCRVVAEGIAQMPVFMMKIMDNGSSTVQRKDPLYRLLGKAPNDWQTSFEFREMMTYHAMLCGGGFAYINRDATGKVVELLPIKPTRITTVQAADTTITYKFRDALGAEQILQQSQVFHLRGPSWDSVNGMDAVQLAREAIGLSIALEESQARLHANGITPSGIFSIDGTLDDEARKRFRARISEMNEGLSNAGRTLILDRNGKYTSTSMTSVDAQHLESRKFQLEEICRAFRVFPQMIGFQDKATTYASAEQFFLAHVVHTLSPWVERWEDCITRDLIGDRSDGPGYEICAKFNMTGLMRGDSAARAQFYNSGITLGWMTRNEARAAEGLPHLDGLDEPLTPANLAPGKVIAPPTDPSSVED